MDNSKELLDAINCRDNGPLKRYWANNHTDDIKAALRLIIGAKTPQPIPEDLKAFTMAAMQGLMANPNVVSTRTDGTIVLYSNIERSAITIALATLSELSKHP